MTCGIPHAIVGSFMFWDRKPTTALARKWSTRDCCSSRRLLLPDHRLGRRARGTRFIRKLHVVWTEPDTADLTACLASRLGTVACGLYLSGSPVLVGSVFLSFALGDGGENRARDIRYTLLTSALRAEGEGTET